MPEDNAGRIKLDLDRDRIREVVTEALRMMHDHIEGDFLFEDEDVLNQLEKFLKCGVISTMFYLRAPTRRMPDMELRVDPRRRHVLAKSRLKRRAAALNHMLRMLK